MESSQPELPDIASLNTHLAENPRIDTLLKKNWKFHKGDADDAQTPTYDDTSWANITLPHTWNDVDGENDSNYYRGISWYRLHYAIPADYAGRQFYLQFDGASLVTDAYVNGTHLGQHRGGYTIFRFDATAALNIGDDNIIAVKVNNAFNTNIPPLNGDFTVFGGLYRNVHLIVTDKVHMHMLDHGSSGLFLRQSDVSAASATLEVTAEIWNDNDSAQDVTLNTVIIDADMQNVGTLSATQHVAAHTGFTFVQTTTLADPHLWDGQRDPYLYSIHALVQVGSSVKDVVSAPLGLRSYYIDPDKGFFLNGRYLDLHGVNVHQDRIQRGWAISDADLDEDFRIMVDMGTNIIRPSHYQQSQHLYNTADANGIIMWSEQPIINSILPTTEFTESAKLQLIEMVRQNYNHPSIIFWSIANEPFNTPEINVLLAALNAVVKEQDPDRITVMADCTGTFDEVALHTDTVGYNRYFGWYGRGDGSGLNDFLLNTHRDFPGQSFALTEYGAGASIHHHQENPSPPIANNDYFHPEEWQTKGHEMSWLALDHKPYIWCKLVWVMFDLAAAWRNEGDHKGRNDKGLCTYDRQTKDAYHWYKANWTTSPLVYITARRHIHRTWPTTTIKVYSNMSTVSLTVNGTALEAKSSTNHIFLWPNVALQIGDNSVQAVGVQDDNTQLDEVIWNYSPDIRINAGARLPFSNHTGTFYDVDHYYRDGSNGATTVEIAGASDQTLYQTYRYGSNFGYSIPAINGTYMLTLYFVEPSMTENGQRVFSVSANGTCILNDLDIYSLVGQNVALQRKFSVTVSNETLVLDFRASVGEALMCAFSLVRQ